MKIIITTAIALIAATGAVAQPAADARSTAKVSYADLDLGARAGQATLTQRVTAAARRVCDAGNGNLDLASQAAIRRCMQIAVATAMTGVAPRPQLAYAGH